MGCLFAKEIKSLENHEIPTIEEAVIELARFCARCQQPNAEPVLHNETCEYLCKNCWPDECVVICDICDQKCIKNQRCACCKLCTAP